jgi:hypothetical protein
VTGCVRFFAALDRLIRRWVRAGRRDHAFLLALFVTGVLVNLFFSRMGFMPLDASIVFEGGWRILNGQVPWRDFTTPNGVVPAAMQAVVFALAGRTWFAYCLHASLVNGAFAALVYGLLVLLRLPRALAFFYGLCATFFFYPPVGFPFMEQHSFFFTLAAVTSAVAGNAARHERAQSWCWRAVPPLAVLAFLSKQVPFAFAAPVLIVLLLVPGRAALARRTAAAAGSVAVTIGTVGILLLLLRVPWAILYEYVIVRPGEVRGIGRSAFGDLAARVAQRYDSLPTAMGLVFIEHAVVLYTATLIALPLAAGLWIAARRRDPAIADDLSPLATAVVLAPALYVTSMLLGFVANNQTQNSVAYYPVSAGVLHAGVLAALRLVSRGISLTTDREGRPATFVRIWRRPALVLAVVLVSIAPLRHWTRDTVTWVADVDMTRMVNDMTFDFALARRSAEALPAGMEFLRWTPSPASYDLTAWAELVTFLRARKQNFFILGDTLVTYGLVGRPSVAPNLWFHPGLSLPDPGEPAFAAYEQDLLARLRRHDVRYIVVEGKETRMYLGLHHFPALSAWLAAEWTPVQSFGIHRVYERKMSPRP